MVPLILPILLVLSIKLTWDSTRCRSFLTDKLVRLKTLGCVNASSRDNSTMLGKGKLVVIVIVIVIIIVVVIVIVIVIVILIVIVIVIILHKDTLLSFHK